MIIKEYRIVLPMTVEEYKIGQSYCKDVLPNETNIYDNVEVIKNEPLENYPLMGGQSASGQYSYKVHKLDIPVPFYLRFIILKQFFEFHEVVWDAYPYRKVVVTNPGFMKNDFLMSAEVMNWPGRGEVENIFELSPEKLEMREVIYIDIANDRLAADDYIETEDPSKFKSSKTDRGPLIDAWKESVTPVMCSYRLVTVKFKWIGLQRKAEALLQSKSQEIYLKFHRQVFCWIDQWYDLTDADIREKARQANDANQDETALANIKYIYSNFPKLFFQ